MNTGVGARLIIVILLAVAPLGPLGATALMDGHETQGPTRDAVTTLEERMGAPVGADRESTINRKVLVDVTLVQNATVPREGIEIERVYSREGARHLRGYVPLSAVRQLSNDPNIRAVHIRSIPGAEDGIVVNQSSRTAPGVGAIGADVLHERGLTGENVTVGVIDAAFRVSDPEIAANVGSYRSFDAGSTDMSHGTAVASVVTDTAPDATLQLAAVGETTTADEYRRAIKWLEASGADIIVDAGSYFGQPGDGTGDIARIAANASNDTLVITSAGNYGQRHWSAPHDASGGPEYVPFAPDAETNSLAAGQPMAGRVTVSLQWDGWPNTTHDYDLYLFRRQIHRDELVATSQTRQANGGGAPAEYIDVNVPRGHYYIAIRAHNVTGTHRVTMFANRDLQYRSAAGSLTAPGTALGVLTIGAYDEDRVAPFSSRGPIANRSGIDLVAPDNAVMGTVEVTGGTSYAAPYVAGTGALLAARYPKLSAAQLREALRSSATDVGPEGVDPESGHGLLNAQSALENAKTIAEHTAANESTT